MQTYLSKSIDLTERKSELDESCKRLLSDKYILAWILKSTTEEFKHSAIEEIRYRPEGFIMVAA